MFPKLIEILSLVELSKMKVLAGEGGLSNEVKFVTIMDNPDIVYWMEESELLLTNGYFLKDYSSKRMIRFIEELIAKNISGLFIKFKRFIMEFPKDVLEYADKKEFPIIEVPVEMSWTDISDPVNRYLNEKQFYFLHQAMSLRDSMLSLLLSGGTLGELCDLASDSIGKQLAIYDEKMKLIARSKYFNYQLFLVNDIRVKMRHRYTLPIDELIKYEHYSIQLQDDLFFLLPIEYGTDTWGYIVLETSYLKPLIFADISKAEQLAALSVVEISKMKELKKIEKQYYSEFITHWIMGEMKELVDIIQRGKQLNRQIYDHYVICLLERQKKNCFEDILDQMVVKFKGDTLVTECFHLEKEGRYLFLFPVLADEKTRGKLPAIYDFLSHFGRVSISDEHKALAVPLAYREAKFAYSCSEMMRNKKIFFKETGILQLFFTSDYELDKYFVDFYYKKYIQPLIDYDKQRNTELIKTLQTFIDHHLNIKDTAESLFIHENTLRSRIKRVEQVTRKDLQNVHDVFQLMLGMYLYKFITSNEAERKKLQV